MTPVLDDLDYELIEHTAARLSELADADQDVWATRVHDPQIYVRGDGAACRIRTQHRRLARKVLTAFPEADDTTLALLVSLAQHHAYKESP